MDVWALFPCLESLMVSTVGKRQSRRTSQLVGQGLLLSGWGWLTTNLRKPKKEALMIITASIRALLMQPLETPRIQLTIEWLELFLTKICRNYSRHEELFIQHFPSATMRLRVQRGQCIGWDGVDAHDRLWLMINPQTHTLNPLKFSLTIHVMMWELLGSENSLCNSVGKLLP